MRRQEKKERNAPICKSVFLKLVLLRSAELKLLGLELISRKAMNRAS